MMLRGVLEVFGGFEQRRDGQAADEALGRVVRQPGLARQQEDDEQVAELARHADDQRADAAGAVRVEVFDQQAVAGKHRVRLGTGGCPRVRERPRRAQFLLDERHAPGFVPVLEVLAGMPGERHELPERLVVETGVLPDVERGEVEAEHVHRAQHGQGVPFGDAPRADLHERGVEFFQVGGEFAGAGVGTRVRRDAGVGGVARELEQEQPGVLFPGFLGRVVEDGLPAFARFLHEPGQVGGKRRGRTLDVVRQAQAAGEMRQLAADDEQAARAQFGQRFARGVRRDERVAVAVAADPGAETQPGQRAPVAEQARRRSRCRSTPDGGGGRVPAGRAGTPRGSNT